MTLSPDGRYAYVADKESCDIREIDTRTFQVVAVVRTPESYGCPYGIAATATDGVVETATGSDYTLALGKQGDVFERVDMNTSSTSILHGVGNDPLTVTDSPDGLAYVVDADSPLITVVNTRDDRVVRKLDLAG
jgi:YVTN family beta-propeller protein